MRLATWNVNSLRVRLEQILEWLESAKMDVLCLQETKLRDELFPVSTFSEIGYDAVFAGQPSYNGVAILTKRTTVGPVSSVIVGNPCMEDEQKRLISVVVKGVQVVCGYFPNGQTVGSPAYAYKLRWMDALITWLRQRKHEVILMGDYNIAPENRDVYDPKRWEGQVLVSPPERERFSTLLDLGLTDAFRLLNQVSEAFTWWDYRRERFARNAGLRIDHILVSSSLAKNVRGCCIERGLRERQQPSDHAPVWMDLAVGDDGCAT